MTQAIRSQIEPLLEEFKKANGKGNVNIANLALIKIVEALVSHIETHSHWPNMFNPVPAAAPAYPMGVPFQSEAFYTIPGLPPFAGHVVGFGPLPPVGLPPMGWNDKWPTPKPDMITQEAADAVKEIGIDESEVIAALTEEGKKEVLPDAAMSLKDYGVVGLDHIVQGEPSEAPQKADPRHTPKKAAPKAVQPVKRGRGRPRKV